MTCTCGGIISRTFLTACVSTVCVSGQVRSKLDRAFGKGTLDCGCLVILLVDVPSRDGAFFVLKDHDWKPRLRGRRPQRSGAAFSIRIFGDTGLAVCSPLGGGFYTCRRCRSMIAARADARLLFHWEDS
jgi:hypothetical protein